MGRRNRRRGRNRWNGSRRSSRHRKGQPKVQIEEDDGHMRAGLSTQKDGRIIWKLKGPDDYPHVRVAPFPMCFTQEALDELMSSVGRRLPETGAKGFSPIDGVGFDVVEYDVRGSAKASGSVYSPDVSWGIERQEFHLNAENMRGWSGDIHSHPYGEWSGRPSSSASGSAKGDLGYVRAVFEMNESMQYFLLPIITHGPMVLRSGSTVTGAWLHSWVIERGREDEPMIACVKVCEASEFPTRIFNPEWEAALADSDSTDTGAVKTIRPRTMTDHALREEFRKRLGDAVSENFHHRGIMVVGVGAGSYMVEKLARMSPASISLCDPDVVETPNLARTSYELRDVGSAKVDAMAERIQRINPSVTLKVCAERIQELGDSDLDEMFEGVGVVVAGTDNFEAQAFLNQECVRRGVPVMFIGIHNGGEGGRIRWVVPGGPCYRCIDSFRYEEAEADIEALDLDGANGSIVDCQLIDSIALKICVALLERGQKSGFGAFYDALEDKSEVVVINSEDYEWGEKLMDAIFASEDPTLQKSLDETRAYFGPLGTIWLDHEKDVGCPICAKVAESSSEASPSSSSISQIGEVSI